MINNETKYPKSTEKDITKNKSVQGSTTFVEKTEDVKKEQELKYTEKVMVSVHRGAGDVKKIVRESIDPKSSDLLSVPGSNSLKHSLGSSGENSSRNKMVLTHEVPVKKTGLDHSSREKNFENGMTKQDETQSLKLKGDWRQLNEEFVVKHKAETTNASVEVKDKEIGMFSQDEIDGEKSFHLLQPKDSSTPVQDDSLPVEIERSEILTDTTRKSFKVVDQPCKSLPMEGIKNIC